MSQPAQVPTLPSSTLWATPSREWVIPARPKPGRKPKKEPVLPAQPDQEVDSKGRRVQNRAAQRAFRERKQSQLADLQARIQQYEQGEIERNVALQNVAKRLKEENEKLANENMILREKLVLVESERDACREKVKKRWRELSRPSSPPSAAESPSKKRSRVSADLGPGSTTLAQEEFPTAHSSHVSSPTSMSSPESLPHSSFSPTPTLPPLRDTLVFSQGSNNNNTLGTIFDLISTGKTNVFESGGSMETFDCGFCNESTPCVCRELAIQQVADRLAAPTVPKVENLEHNELMLPLDTERQPQSSTPTSGARSSILDNLPGYQPPVPLRRRAVNVAVNSVFPVSSTGPSVQQPTDKPLKSASCSGDPSNCMACADDAFGRAFCAAINKSAVDSPPCVRCPGRCGEGSVDSCCGNPTFCGNHPGSEVSQPAPLASASVVDNSRTPPSSTSPSETVPCDDAWRQIKLHPNVSFADLSLLAEVVARRSKCTGPRVEITPAPGSVTPERGISPSLLSASLSSQTGIGEGSIQLVEPRPGYRKGDSSQISSGVVATSCGRSGIREVQADGVRDALRLLDLKYSSAT